MNFLMSAASTDIGTSLSNLWQSTGFVTYLPEYYLMHGYTLGIWGMFIMIIIAGFLIWLAIAKKFEPMLLLSIAFGMLIINIPGVYSVLYGTGGYTFTDEVGKVIAQGTLSDLCDSFGGYYVAIYDSTGACTNIQTLEYFCSYARITFDANNIQASYNSLSTLLSSGYTSELITVAYNNASAETLNASLASLQQYLSLAWNDLGAVGTYAETCCTYGIIADKGLIYYLYKGVDWVIFPPLIFLGIGAMTDFGPLIANPKSLLLGAAAQLGIFMTFIGALFLGFNEAAASSIAIIGGADGPTAIYLTQKMASKAMSNGTSVELLPAIAIAAYSYMALVPVIQPPIMKALTTKKERLIRMEQLRPVSKKEKIIFPIVVTAIVGIVLPSALPLLGMLMLGNLFRESGVVPRLSKTAENELINIITIFLGVTVGTKAFAPIFLQLETLEIIVLGVVAFSFGTAGGVLLGKLMCKLTKGKINPLIGAAGVSAVPMAARVAHDVGRKEDPDNYLLMHAMGPNVAGVIGSAVAAGVLIAMFA